MDRQYTNQKTLLAEAAVNGKGIQLYGESFRNIELEIVMTGFTGTIKIAGSNADTCPDFGAAASLTNPWDFIKCVNQIDGSSVNGGTGITGAASTSVTQLECNTNGFKWICPIVSGYTGGTVTVKGKGYSNF